MQYKILEANGIEIENVDGGAFNNFTAGGKSGVIGGVLNECSMSVVSNNLIIGTGLLLIKGIRVKITEPYSITFNGTPIAPENYFIVASVTLNSNGAVSFYITISSPIEELRQGDIYKTESGVYDLLLAEVTHFEDGSIEFVRKVETLHNSGNGGSGLTETEKNKVDKIKTDGDGTKYLADDGTYKTVVSGGSNITVDTELSNTSTNPVQNKVIYAKLNELENAINYKPIDITSFTVSPSKAEKGATVSVTLSWALNKQPTTQTLDGSTIGNDVRSKTFTGVNSTTAYTLKATDEKDKEDVMIVAIYFYNGVYYGVASEPTSYNSGFILGLTRELQKDRKFTFTVTAGAGEYIYYCVPTAYGECSFNVGGFDGGFTKVSTIEFTNEKGHPENYDIYRSDNANLGNTTVKAS